MAYFRRSTARKKRDNLKRFPGPAGMLPRLVTLITVHVVITIFCQRLPEIAVKLRQLKKWTASANVPNATSVLRPGTVYFGTL